MMLSYQSNWKLEQVKGEGRGVVELLVQLETGTGKRIGDGEGREKG